MTRLDDEVERLARRMSVARLGLARGGPTPLLAPLVEPVIEAAQEVLRMAAMDLQPTFAAVDQPIGPATTDVLAEMVATPVEPDDPERGTRDQPVIRDAMPGDYIHWPEELFRLDHVHNLTGECVKNRYPTCEVPRADR